MFHHIGMLTLTENAAPQQIDAIEADLLALPSTIPGLLRACVYRDAGLTQGNANLIFHMTFTDQVAWEDYRAHPDHVAVIRNRIGPVLASKAFVQVTA